MVWRIRRSSRDDVPALAALRRAWTEERAGEPIDDELYGSRFQAWHAREGEQRITWLAERDGQSVGMLNLLVFTRMPKPVAQSSTPPAHQWGYIANVFVLAAHRNLGIGAALVSAAVDFADVSGFARLVLSPSARSVAFYERAGFLPATSLLMRIPGESD